LFAFLLFSLHVKKRKNHMKMLPTLLRLSKWQAHHPAEAQQQRLLAPAATESVELAEQQSRQLVAHKAKVVAKAAQLQAL
jgi:hypothetical protein